MPLLRMNHYSISHCAQRWCLRRVRCVFFRRPLMIERLRACGMGLIETALVPTRFVLDYDLNQTSLQHEQRCLNVLGRLHANSILLNQCLNQSFMQMARASNEMDATARTAVLELVGAWVR